MAKVTVTKTNQNDFEGTPATRLAVFFQLIVAWTVVAVPLIYGVSQVFIKSLALFQ